MDEITSYTVTSTPTHSNGDWYSASRAPKVGDVLTTSWTTPDGDGDLNLEDSEGERWYIVLSALTKTADIRSASETVAVGAVAKAFVVLGGNAGDFEKILAVARAIEEGIQ